MPHYSDNFFSYFLRIASELVVGVDDFSGAVEHSRSGGVPWGQPANERCDNEGSKTCGGGL